ncbi:hypothetical protein BZA77DRAFT_83026 [Pyronema omphalodes]|nr:hypothetical protein BZA77DRAFT_83026 [Pyronema omphalodes]
MIPGVEVSSSADTPVLEKDTPPALPPKIELNTLTQTRSPEPISRSGTPRPISPFAAQQILTQPETANLVAAGNIPEICQQDLTLTPSQTALLSPTLTDFAPFTTAQMLTPTDQVRRDSPGSKPQQTMPTQRFYGSETPDPSSMTALLQQQNHRDTDVFPPDAANLTSNMPPSPPLTRHSATSVRWAGSPRQTPPPPPPHALTESNLQPRPSTASGSSTVSTSRQGVRDMGKQLGKTPIDYLLPNGSLPAPVSGYFHPTHDPCNLDPPPGMQGDDEVNPVEGIFGHLNFLLENYLQILSAGGSIAVGTGYNSMARRLLDQIGHVFGRDIEVDGVGWADVLEYLRGGREKPFLCVLPVRGLLARQEAAASVVGGRGDDKMASARELAESVVGQVKIKPAMVKVEQWIAEVEAVLRMNDPNDNFTEPLTKQEEQEERLVCEIIEGTLRNNIKEENQIKQFRRILEDRKFNSKIRLGMTRLYSDYSADSITAPIAALYVLLYPEMTRILLALADVFEDELELINSGRFDSLLDGSTNVVARDEEEELEVITNLDRRLWTVLESLEDELEDLHSKALIVRRALKSRRECIAQKRPTPVNSPSPEARRDEKERRRAEEEQEWAINVPSLNVPIEPDDSASNITFHRRRQEKANKELDRVEEEKRRRKEKKRSVSDDHRHFLNRFSVNGPVSAINEEGEKSDAGTSTRRRKKRESHGGDDRRRSKSDEHGSGLSKDDKEKRDKEERRKERKERNDDGERDKERSSKDRDRDRDRERARDKDKEKERERRKEGKEGKEGKESKTKDGDGDSKPKSRQIAQLWNKVTGDDEKTSSKSKKKDSTQEKDNEKGKSESKEAETTRSRS